MKNIKTIAFDADDTLWVNETYFHEAENEFCDFLKDYATKEEISAELFKIEMKNLPLYGYGIKGFVLCMIETANKLSQQKMDSAHLDKIIQLGHSLLEKPIELLDGVSETLENLSGKYQLILATKGDLLDQERKLKKSGLEDYFHHVEIMSDKKNSDYQKLLSRLNTNSEDFLMLGNSVKSDILPVLEIGGYSAYIPFHVTWAHEQSEKVEHERFVELTKINEILNYLN